MSSKFVSHPSPVSTSVVCNIFRVNILQTNRFTDKKKKIAPGTLKNVQHFSLYKQDIQHQTADETDHAFSALS